MSSNTRPDTLVQDRTLQPPFSLATHGGSIHWVMCGRRLIDKGFFTLMQHWSGAVMCPACLCGADGRWP